MIINLKTKKNEVINKRAGEYRGAVHSICNLKNSYLKRFLYNGSNYDYHFILNDLAEEFKKPFTYLGENTEKYKIFTVPIEKEVRRIYKNGEEISKIYVLHITVYW